MWILPFAVLFALVAYAVLAIAFYNSDDWFQFICVYDNGREHKKIYKSLVFYQTPQLGPPSLTSLREYFYPYFFFGK